MMRLAHRLSLVMFPALVLGCDDQSVKLGDTSAPPGLGPPWFAVVLSVSDGYFNGITCRVTWALVDADTGTAEAGGVIAGDGGEWAGAPLQPGRLYRADVSHEGCGTGTTASGEFSSNSFSGVEGDLQLFWFNAANGGFTAMAQDEDFNGGRVWMTLSGSGDATDLQEMAAAVGGDTGASVDGEQEIIFPPSTSVGEVLTTLAADPAFATGHPDWRGDPEWW